jgi:hypothetical protein
VSAATTRRPRVLEMQFLSYLLVAQTFQGASDMAAPVLSTRSHLKRKRAQVSYYEGTSDEGDSDESSSSVEDCVPRKVQFSGGRLLAANSILTTFSRSPNRPPALPRASPFPSGKYFLSTLFQQNSRTPSTPTHSPTRTASSSSPGSSATGAP